MGESEFVQSVEVSHCRSCGAVIWWGETNTGKRCPYDIVNDEPTQESHFKSCPQARDWSRKALRHA